jgi:hypothetical protein
MKKFREKILEAMRKRGEKAIAVENLQVSGNEVGIGQESCERLMQSSSR